MEWVNVKDRLPEEGQSVLMAEYPNTSRVYIVVGLYYAKMGFRLDYPAVGQLAPEVRYWMPLPEPPQ